MRLRRPRPPRRSNGPHTRFRTIFETYFGQALRHYELDEDRFPLRVIVAATTSFQLGLIVEGLSGVHHGHDELLAWIQQWLDGLEAEQKTTSDSDEVATERRPKSGRR